MTEHLNKPLDVNGTMLKKGDTVAFHMYNNGQQMRTGEVVRIWRQKSNCGMGRLMVTARAWNGMVREYNLKEVRTTEVVKCFDQKKQPKHKRWKVQLFYPCGKSEDGLTVSRRLKMIYNEKDYPTLGILHNQLKHHIFEHLKMDSSNVTINSEEIADQLAARVFNKDRCKNAFYNGNSNSWLVKVFDSEHPEFFEHGRVSDGK